MLVELSPALLAGLKEELSNVDQRRLVHRARLLSERYRAHQARGRERFVCDPMDALAYAALILPAAHAQISGALRMVPRRAPDFAPESLLDVGSGPGTVGWAATAIWPSLSRITGCEAEPGFIDLARSLNGRSDNEAQRRTTYRQGDILAEGWPGGRHDLVILSLVLSELGRRDRRKLLARSWAACEGVLVVIEPGTPATFEVVREARDQLRRAGAQTLAPCPHEEACPLTEEAWCHFNERSERPDFQRRVKGASLPWEDVRFSFVALTRGELPARPWARVLHEPNRAKGRVHLSLCTARGLVELGVPKRERAAHRAAKSLEWGSAIEAGDDLVRP